MSKKKWAILGLLSFAQLIIALDYNIVFVALPAISENLSFSPAGLQWVVSAYAVVFGGFLLLGGRLSDLFGRKIMFILGMLLYGVASLLGGLAVEPWMIILARAGQGIGGAILAPATLALVNILFTDPARRNRAIGVWAGSGSTGMILGSLFGGVLTSAFGWEAVFFVNVPLTVIGVTVALLILPTDRLRGAGTKLDIPGALTSTAGVLAIVYGIVRAPEVGWADRTNWIFLLGGGMLVLLFVIIEKLVRAPLIPIRLLSNRDLRLGAISTLLFMASFGAIPYFVTLYLQGTVGLSPFSTGLVFLLPSACVLIGTFIGGKLGVLFSGRAILFGAWTVGGAATTLMAGVMFMQGSLWLGALPFTVLSLSQGVIFTVMYSVSTSTIRAADQGVGAGIAQSGQQIGGAVGLAVLVAVASVLGQTAIFEETPGFTTSGLLAIVALMVLGLLSPLIGRRSSVDM